VDVGVLFTSIDRRLPLAYAESEPDHPPARVGCAIDRSVARRRGPRAAVGGCNLPGMSAARQRLGELGERVAARWLRANGWAIVAARWRCGHRDVDLIIEQGDIVAFVEVKARRRGDFGGPLGAVGWRKQRELERSAEVWIARFGGPKKAYRFDVFGVLFHDETVRVRHVENAFELRSRT
jgi:putative endonuclease